MKNNNYIEKLFRKNFEGYKINPSEKVWQNLRKKLLWENFLHFRWNSFNVYYLGGLILLAGGMLFIKNKPTPSTVTSEEFEILTQKTDSLINSEKDKLINDSLLIKNKQRNIAEEAEQRPQNQIREQDRKKSPVQEEKSGAPITAIITDSLENQMPLKKVAKEPEITEKLPSEAEELLNDSISNTLQPDPKAFFIPSVFEGCVPLQVVFENNSVGIAEFEWSFGDGGSSEVEDPVYIFDEPGNYFVSLTVRGPENRLSTYSEIITVHPVPVASFEMDIDETQGAGKAVYFYNYSRGAENYQWFFDDGTTSDLEEPTKFFEEDNDHSIKLIATSENGCADSMILENAFSSDEPELVFPNAFSPNPEGPVGGYYSPTEGSNDVFHPYMPEEPVEYTLRIFNKTGNLIFESKDPYIGWDGYYLQELQPQGVYIYKVKARFKNGKQVVKMGDVTLIHEERW